MWQPDVTVAAICERDGHFLLVEERSKSTGQIVLNQPAGHLEDNETLIAAVQRETLEETCCEFTPVSLIGLYRLRTPAGKTYIRYTFSGDVSQPLENRELDPDIIRTRWMSLADIKKQSNLRSHLVLSCIEDFLQGTRYPLSVIRDL